MRKQTKRPKRKTKRKKRKTKLKNCHQLKLSGKKLITMEKSLDKPLDQTLWKKPSDGP